MIPAASARIDLATMPYDRFADLVNRDFHGRASAAESAALRRPENVVAWHRELVFIRSDVEEQINEVRLCDDPEPVKAERLRKMRTVHKHLNRLQHQARYTMDAAGLTDASIGRIVGTLHALEHVLIDGHLDDANAMLESLLDRLPRLLRDAA